MQKISQVINKIPIVEQLKFKIISTIKKAYKILNQLDHNYFLKSASVVKL